MLKSLIRLLSFRSSTPTRNSRVGRRWTTEHLELRLLLTAPVVDSPVDPEQTAETADASAEVSGPVDVSQGTPPAEQEPDIEFIWRDPLPTDPTEQAIVLAERALLEARFITQLHEMAEVGNLTGQIAETMLDPTDDFTMTIIFQVGISPHATIPGQGDGGLGQGIFLDPELMDEGFVPADLEFPEEAPVPTEEYPDADFYVVIAHEFAHRYPELTLLDPHTEAGGAVLVLENTVREELGMELRETYDGEEPPYGTTTIYELSELSDDLSTGIENEISRLEAFYPPVDESDADLYGDLFDTTVTDILISAQQEEELQLEIPIEEIEIVAPIEEEVQP